MDVKRGRTLTILTAVEDTEELTQRFLAKRLQVSVGTANRLVRKLVAQGWILLNRSNGRPQYELTDSGRTESRRLRGQRQAVRLREFVQLRDELAGRLAGLRGVSRRLILYGAGDVAQIAYMAAAVHDFEVVAVVDDNLHGKRFLNLTVQPLQALRDGELEFDAMVITTAVRRDRRREVFERFISAGTPVLDLSS